MSKFVGNYANEIARGAIGMTLSDYIRQVHNWLVRDDLLGSADLDPGENGRYTSAIQAIRADYKAKMYNHDDLICLV